MNELRNAYFTIQCDYDQRFVRLTRTKVPFAQLTELDECFAFVQKALAPIPRSRFGLLVDTRGSPKRNDPEFEHAFARHRKQMLAGFQKRAILTSTAVGRLQVQRHALIDGLGVRVFENERDALAFLGVRESVVPST